MTGDRLDHWNRSTKRWGQLRAEHLLIEPNCRACATDGKTTPADVIDQIIPPYDGGQMMPSHAGLESLCTTCWTQKHMSKLNEPRGGITTVSTINLPRFREGKNFVFSGKRNN